MTTAIAFSFAVAAIAAATGWRALATAVGGEWLAEWIEEWVA